MLIGVRADGRKELVALADGYRESTESWADLLRDCRPARDARPGAGGRRRGAGVLGRAARGLPAAREQRCWFHKIANVPGGTDIAMYTRESAATLAVLADQLTSAAFLPLLAVMALVGVAAVRDRVLPRTVGVVALLLTAASLAMTARARAALQRVAGLPAVRPGRGRGRDPDPQGRLTGPHWVT